MKYLFQSFGEMSEAEHRLAYFAGNVEMQLTHDSSNLPDENGDYFIKSPEGAEASEDAGEKGKSSPEKRKSAADNPDQNKKKDVSAVADKINKANAKVEGYAKNYQKAADTGKVEDWQGDALKKMDGDLETPESKSKMEECSKLLTDNNFTPEEAKDAIGVLIAMVNDPEFANNEDAIKQFPLAQKIRDNDILFKINPSQTDYLKGLGDSLDAVQAEQEAKPEKGKMSLKSQNELVDKAKTDLAKFTPEKLDSMTPAQTEQEIGNVMSKHGVSVSLKEDGSGFDITPPSNGMELMMNKIMGYITYFGSIIQGLKPAKDGEKPKTNGEKRVDDYTSRLKTLNDSKDNTQVSISTEVKDGKVSVNVTSESGLPFTKEAVADLKTAGATEVKDNDKAMRIENITAEQLKTLEGLSILSSADGRVKAKEDLNTVPENETPEARSKREGLKNLLDAGALPLPSLSNDPTQTYSIDSQSRNYPQIRFNNNQWELKGSEESWDNPDHVNQPYNQNAPKAWNELLNKLTTLNGDTETKEKENSTEKNKNAVELVQTGPRVERIFNSLLKHSGSGYDIPADLKANVEQDLKAMRTMMDENFEDKNGSQTLKEGNKLNLTDLKALNEKMAKNEKEITREADRAKGIVVKKLGEEELKQFSKDAVTDQYNVNLSSWYDVTGTDQDMYVKYNDGTKSWEYMEDHRPDLGWQDPRNDPRSGGEQAKAIVTKMRKINQTFS